MASSARWPTAARILGSYAGVYNYASGTTNNGTLSTGIIGTLTNSGTISGGSGNGVGIGNEGVIGSISNAATGTITEVYRYIYNGRDAFIGGISNAGTISSIYNDKPRHVANAVAAISNTGVLGTITNYGVIAGNIINNTANDLTINGGRGDTGVLTGFPTGTGDSIVATQGTISNTQSDLFISNQHLNDVIDVGAHTVFARDNISLINASISVTGNYSQTIGGIFESEARPWNVSGAAALTTISVNGGGAFNANANYLVGDAAGTLVQGGAGSSYA